MRALRRYTVILSSTCPACPREPKWRGRPVAVQQPLANRHHTGYVVSPLFRRSEQGSRPMHSRKIIDLQDGRWMPDRLGCSNDNVSDVPIRIRIPLRERWWIRIRRSFGVPDLVADGHATSLILNELTPPFGSSVLLLLNAEAAINCLLQAAIDLGGRGQLDDLFSYPVTGREQQRLPVSEQLGLPSTPQIRLLTEAAADPDWPAMHQAMAQSLMDELKPVALRLLEAVSASMRALPFEETIIHSIYFAPAD